MSQHNSQSESSSQNGRSKWRKWGLAALAVIGGFMVVQIGAAAAFAGHFGGCRHYDDPEARQHKIEKISDRVLNKIDATDEQRAAIQPLLPKLAGAWSTLHDSKKSLKDDLLTALEAENVDAEALQAIKSQGLKDLDTALNDVIVFTAQVSEVLTDEQREELLERIARHHRRHHDDD